MRAVVPGIVKDEDILQPIEPGLKQYPVGSAEFVEGEATNVDKGAKTVNVATSAGARSIRYDYLVLATGARTSDPSMPWKAANTYQELITSLHSTAESVGKASHIVIAGAGATGVELAAEIKFEFKDKTVVLLCADEDVVGGDWIAGAVQRELLKLGVEIKKEARSEGVEKMADGKTQVQLAGGEKIVTDLYLPTMGLIPNSEFLPDDFLTSTKYADVDEQFRVKASPEDTWALGDLVSKPRASYPETEWQAANVARNVGLALAGKGQIRVGGLPADVLVCSMGRSRGAGRVGWIPAPSLAIWLIKGRTLGMQNTAKYASGSCF